MKALLALLLALCMLLVPASRPAVAQAFFMPVSPEMVVTFFVAVAAIGFVFGLGYIYADEIPLDNSWPWQGIKAVGLSSLSYIVYSAGEQNGQKTHENPGVYLALGSLIYTTGNVFRIIEAKNEYAKELRKHNE